MRYSALTPKQDRNGYGWENTPLFTDISREARDFLEGICNVRYFEQEQKCTDGDPKSPTYGQVMSRWTHVEWVKVRPLAREFGGSGVAEYVIDPCYKADGLEWLKRQGMRPEDVMRPPRSCDWHGLTPEEAAEGQHRVIVNLDTLEYIDPVKFGQPPTLAGMVSLAPKDRELPALKRAEPNSKELVDVAGGLFAMLCHRERRGGGDLPAESLDFLGDDPRSKKSSLFKGATDVKGCWRGGRILGTTETRHEDLPTTEEVIERGTDISDKVIRYLVAITHY